MKKQSGSVLTIAGIQKNEALCGVSPLRVCHQPPRSDWFDPTSTTTHYETYTNVFDQILSNILGNILSNILSNIMIISYHIIDLFMKPSNAHLCSSSHPQFERKVLAEQCS